MNYTEKYGIKMIYNQFAEKVESDFYDTAEIDLIDIFVKSILQLKDLDKKEYTMLELGSNYAYYSMLFKKILEPTKTLNLCLEPYEKYYNAGVEHFKHNNLKANFIKKKIFTPAKWGNIVLDCDQVLVDNLLNEHGIDTLDVLHCDIDGAEVLALETTKEFLTKNKINFLFILTHAGMLGNTEPARHHPLGSDFLHNEVKRILESYGYVLTSEFSDWSVGNDGLVVFKREVLI